MTTASPALDTTGRQGRGRQGACCEPAASGAGWWLCCPCVQGPAWGWAAPASWGS